MTGGVAGSGAEETARGRGASVTVILSSWKRPQHLRRQIQALREQSVPPQEIWVWVETCEENRDTRHDLLPVERVFHTAQRLGVYGRFALGLLASTVYVALFDDDVIPGPGYLQNCITTMRTCPGIISPSGIRLLSTRYRPREKVGWAKRTPEVTEVDVGCNAWFLKQEWLPYLWREPPFNWNNGEDMRLSYLCQKYGGIATYVPAQVSDQTSGCLDWQLGADAVALCLTDEHFRTRTRQLREQLALGWHTLNGIKPQDPSVPPRGRESLPSDGRTP